MKKLLTLFVTCALLLTGCGNGDANPKAVKIGVLQLMTHEALNAALQELCTVTARIRRFQSDIWT